MTSRLSSLLVRDGVVGVKRMEKAFQRQVLFGGGLDTILLEMGEITEQRLLQYLSLATGLPPATGNELDQLDPRAAEVCQKELATRFKVVPLTFDGDALRVLARDPVDIAGLEDLASELEVPVQPFVAPEFRWELTFDRAFGRSSDERFVRVAELVKAAAPAPAVGKPQTVVVDAGLGALQQPTGRKTLIFSGVAMRQEMQRRRRAPSVPDGIVSAVEPEITPPEISMELPDELGGGVIERMAPHDTQRVPFTPSDSRGSEIAAGEIPEAHEFAAAGSGALSAVVTEPPPRVVTSPMATVPAMSTSGSVPVARPSGALSGRQPAAFDPSPLGAGEARALLASAEHRDQVFEVLLRAIRGRAWYAAVLTVQGGAAIGRVAVAGDDIDHNAITQVLIPLDSPSTFRQAVHTASPYIGPIATGDAEIDGMIKRMGGVVPPSALLLPLVLKNRVVALMVGHRGADTLRVTEVSELLPLAGVAGDSLGRIIMRGKSKGMVSVSAPQAIQAEPGPVASTAPVPQDVEEGPTGPHTGIPRLSRSEVSAQMTGAPPRSSFGTIDELMAAAQSEDDEKGTELAIGEAQGRVAEVLVWMAEHFPGKLKVDRFDLGGRHLKAAQHGPVLDLAVRLGPAAAELLIEKMRDGRKEVRYYATLCASESRPEAVVLVMMERLFDPDYGVREVALEGLIGAPVRSLEEALEIPRRALHSEDLDKIKTAAGALAALADTRAIPDLLDVHGRGGDAAVAVGKALVGLTKQDFGINNKKWRQWWDKNRKKNRIEWLLDGLAARDPEIRRSSAEDLRKATGEYFGYHHDLPRRERELARQRWTEWWNQTGRLRFLPPEEHERNRPTAVLPPRRVP